MPSYVCVKEAVFPFTKFANSTLYSAPKCAQQASNGNLDFVRQRVRKKRRCPLKCSAGHGNHTSDGERFRQDAVPPIARRFTRWVSGFSQHMEPRVIFAGARIPVERVFKFIGAAPWNRSHSDGQVAAFIKHPSESTRSRTIYTSPGCHRARVAYTTNIVCGGAVVRCDLSMRSRAPSVRNHCRSGMRSPVGVLA